VNRLDAASIKVAAGLLLLVTGGLDGGMPAALAQTSAKAKLVTTSKTTERPLAAPDASALQPTTTPGAALYVARRGDSIASVARQFVKRTSYLTSAELADAIRKENGNRTGNMLKSGESITIPGILEAPIVEKPVAVGRDFEVRAVYLTGVMAGSEHGLRIIRRWRELGGNAVVFDIKDSDGIVNIAFPGGSCTNVIK
jgi:hypothetical protein